MSHATSPSWSPPAGAVPVSRDMLRAHRQALANKLQVALNCAAIPPSVAVDRVFRLHFGRHRTATERLLFKHFASPLVRQIALHVTGARGVRQDRKRLQQLHQQLMQLRTMDPEGLRIIEMRYFCGCSIREIAALYASTTHNSFIADTAVLTLEDEPPSPREAMRQVKLILRFWAHLLAQCHRANVQWRQ